MPHVQSSGANRSPRKLHCAFAHVSPRAPGHIQVDARKRVRLRSTPPTLLLQLKRFGMDFDTMQYRKVNDPLSFPEQLDLAAYMVDAPEPGVSRRCHRATAPNCALLPARRLLSTGWQACWFTRERRKVRSLPAARRTLSAG